MNSLIAWMVASMMVLAPPDKPTFKAAEETREEREKRYEQIAKDILSVVSDPKEAALFTGPYSLRDSALVVMSIMSYESDFRKDVDFGIGASARGDNGRSWCLMQVNLGNSRTKEGWYGKELVADRLKCIRAGYHLVQRSFFECQKGTEKDRLAMYTSGKCSTGIGASHKRMKLFAKLRDKAPAIADSIIKQGVNAVTTSTPVTSPTPTKQ